MAYEFKKLSDVEVVETPADNANVFIEEDGIIKKAPKTAVGGGEWDAVFTVDNIYDITSDTVYLMSGSYNVIKAKIDANDLPRILIIANYEYGNVMKSCVQPVECAYDITDDLIVIYFISNWGNLNRTYWFCILPDNTISVDY